MFKIEIQRGRGEREALPSNSPSIQKKKEKRSLLLIETDVKEKRGRKKRSATCPFGKGPILRKKVSHRVKGRRGGGKSETLSPN